jgi:SAM-dependent methyltransferase
MTITRKAEPLTLNPQVESEVRTAFIEDEHSRCYPDGYVDVLLDEESIVNRFSYFCSVVGPAAIPPGAPILVSGFSLGAEMIVARRFGFGVIHGVEVDPCLVRLCQKRLSYIPDMHPSYYDGDYLPHDDAQFFVVASGHVIEHTHAPATYLSECMRVLLPGGYLTLEFPSRFHHTELHTGLPSFEWLPRPVRNTLLRLVSSRVSPLDADTKKRYQSILGTNLQQISLGGVKRMLAQTGYKCSLVHHCVAAPGIIRCVIQKQAGRRD